MDIQLTSGKLAAHLRVPDTAVMYGASAASSPGRLTSALQNPLGLPQVHQCVVPGDRVVIVVDPETPAVADVITQVWEQFQALNTEELDVTLLLPGDERGEGWKNLIDELPMHLRHQVAVHVHDSTDERQRRYLASSADGERVYLSHYLTDADLVITIGTIGFDAGLGYRGTSSAIYPAFSDDQAIRTTRLPGNAELTPDDSRPLRDLIDEIGWLLGTQFTVQIVPGGDGGMADVFCGATDKVMAAGQQCLNQRWRLTADEETHLAIISIPGESSFGWKYLGAALETASRLVGDSGRIGVIASLPEHIGVGLEMLRRSGTPQKLLKPLRRDPPEDAIEVTQLIHALLTTRICLLSNLDPSFVEDLGILPLSSASELQRLIDSSDSVVVVPNANYAWAQAVVESRL